MTSDLIFRAERLLDLAAELGPGWLSDKLIVEISAILDCLHRMRAAQDVLALDEGQDMRGMALEAASVLMDDRYWPCMISYAVH